MDGTEIDIRGILGLLRRQFRLILITLVSVVAIVGIIVFSLTPIYSSSALVMVDPTNKNLLEPDAQLGSSSSDNARIDSEVEILRSDSILLKVIDAEKLIADPEFGVSLGLRDRILGFFRLSQPTLPTGQDALNQVLSKLGNAVTAQRRGLTYLISVQASSVSPDTAARLANAVANVYIQDQLAIKVSSVMGARDILQARIIGARNAIVASEGSFDTFISANIERIERDSGRSDFATLQRQISELKQARSQTTATINEIQTNLETGNWQVVVESLQSDALAQLERQRETLAGQIAGSQDTSPAALDLRAELTQVEANMRATATRQVSALRTSINGSQAQEDSLRQQMREQVLNSSLSADVLAQIYELQQNAELARTQYQTLLARAQDLDTQASLQIADSRVVSPALPPRSASFPNRTLMLALATIAALGIGIGLAYLYENLIGGFTSEEQAESVLKTRVASAIPRAKAQADLLSLADLVVKSPLSIFAESIRRIRATVDQDARAAAAESGKGGRVIMISSTAPNEGKTTIGLALARSYALSGRRVLLIDCDLRKPSVHRHLDVEPSHGLYDFLNDFESRGLDVASIASVDSLSRATIIVGARRSEVPTDQLLASASFGKLIDAARLTFEVVILDTPPIGPVVDGLYVAPFADAIVFAIRWASTPQLDARKALAALNAAKRPNGAVVAVLNQQDNAGRNYSQKYGGYYQETS
ncbi:MAG: Wzz/FepE/Etk N-terminal domain-containing protein [Devosia sp.]